jgi:hypothetical protein
MGPRPDNVPEDWVIDHIDRDRFNNTRENLRWVSPSFNAFNAKRPDSGVSRFRGVHLSEQANRFRAKGAGGVHIGNFSSSARPQSLRQPSTYYAVCKWAETSDLLFTRDQLARRFAVSERACRYQENTQEALLPAPITTKSTGVDKTRSGPSEQGMERNIWGLQTFEAALRLRGTCQGFTRKRVEGT